jgi:hypothetical protein
MQPTGKEGVKSFPGPEGVITEVLQSKIELLLSTPK